MAKNAKGLFAALLLSLASSILAINPVFAKDLSFNLSQLSKIYHYQRPAAGGDGSQRRWTQGATITDDYFVFTLIGGDPNNPNVNYGQTLNFARRSAGVNAPVVKTISLEGWGHVNSLHYDWGNNQIWVQTQTSGAYGNAHNITGDNTGGRCFDVSSDVNQIKEAKCKAYGPRGYYSGDISYTGQGSTVVNNYAYIAFYTDGVAFVRVCGKPTGECRAADINHTIKVTGYSSGELEDIAFDRNGDLIFILNFWNSGNYTAFYKMDKSLLSSLGVNTVPTGNASTINYDGSTNTGAPGAGQPGSPGGGSTPSGGTSQQEEVHVQVAPDKEAQCATILSGLCDDSGSGGTGGNGILEIIKLIVSIMTAGVGVLGTIGVIFCGYMILTARDNEAQVSKAKKRIVEIVIGIVVFVLMNVVMNLLLPKQ